MAAQKHLHELLKQDQEPFQLKNYINDRRSQLKRTTNATNNHPKTTSSAVHGRKRKPSLEALTTSTIPKRSLCKHACFFSFNDSPDLRKSPFPDFRSPAKSPTKGGKVYLHVPPRTAALLLEAAMRIQRQQTSSSISKPKSQVKNIGFGLLSSFVKKLKDRNRNKRYEIRGSQFEIPTSTQKMKENVAVGSSVEEGCSCSYNNSRLSSAGWSESHEEKSPDMETSTSSSRSQDSEGMNFVSHNRLINCSSPEDRFFTSPLSPFRFSLQRSPSFAGGRKPDFSSPAASPSRHKDEEKKKYDGNAFDEIKELEAEEEKEQCSPVSVLDPAFQDEDDDDDGHEEEEDDEDYDDLECSFAFVQRAKEQLLYKLRRFEKLAELDPVELEKRMMEQLDEDEDDDDDDDKESLDVLEEEGEDKECSPLHRGCSSILDSFVNEVCTKSSLQSRRKVPTDMKRLVSDLISEEKRAFRFLENREIVVGRVCKKLDSWKEVESNTIDMMVEWDFRSELDEWKRFQERRDETAMEIEIAIFGDLLDQLSDELLY